MAGYIERGETKAAAWADWLARFDLLLFIIAGLSHRYGLIATPEFFWVLAVIGSIGALALLLAAVAFRRLWLFGDRGGRLAARATLVALLLIVPFLVSGWQILRYPSLNDISTDLDDPPLFSALAQLRSEDMNPIEPISIVEAENQASAFPEITGRRYEAAPDTVIEAATAILNARNWRIAARTENTIAVGEHTIELVARSLMFGFESDAVIRITDEGETTYVDMRSASRYGVHDLGSNAARIRSFLDSLDDEVASRAGGQSPES